MRLFKYLYLVIFILCSCSRLAAPTQRESEASMSTLLWLDNKYGMVQNVELQQMLNRVASRIAAVVPEAIMSENIFGVMPSHYSDFAWQVYIAKIGEANAFSVGAGNIVVTIGMVAETRSEAELASILCHEMSHQILGHSSEAIRHQQNPQANPQFAYTLNHELAADRLGLQLLHLARYETSAALEALSIGYRPIDSVASGLPPDWLILRISQLRDRVAELKTDLPATQTTRQFSRVRKQLIY